MRKKKKEPLKQKHLYPRAFRNYIADLCACLRWYIFHGEYKMDITYHEEIVVKGAPPTPHGKTIAAAIDIDSTYLACEVQISRQIFIAYKNEDWKFIGDALVHEFSHLITEPLYNFACDAATASNKEHLEDIRERQTQRIANIVMYQLRNRPHIFEASKRGKEARKKV